MAIDHLAIDTIGEPHLQALIDAAVPEARRLEFKQATYGGNDESHFEFLADISSLANTAGGDLILGISATGGVPNVFMPFIGDADAEILRLETLARSGLQPRLPSLRSKAVPLGGGGHAIILRVLKSHLLPHRIVRKGKGEHRFFARSSNGRYEADVNELRAMFLASPQIADRLRAFHNDRVDKILAGTTPLPLIGGGALVLHVMPFASFELASDPVEIARVWEDYLHLSPMGSSSPWNRQVNFDGVVTGSNASNADPQRAYVQFFRVGAIEAVASSLMHPVPPNNEEMVPYLRLESLLTEGIARYALALERFGASAPFAILASLISLKGTPMLFSDGGYPSRGSNIERDRMTFREIVVDSAPAQAVESARMLKPILDQIANVGGEPRSPSFDAEGNYRRRQG